MSQVEHPENDEGFTLMEVVVSMLVFAVLSAAVAGLLYRSSVTTAVASQRNVATNIADQQKEYLLGIDWSDVVSGSQTVKQNGADYSVKTSVVFIPDAASGNACSVASGASLASKKVVVSVTWPAMGKTPPVEIETLRPIPMAETGSVLGAVGWQLKDATGKGLAGVGATLTSAAGQVRTAAADANGCVVFSDLPAGAYSVGVNSPGYVGPNNTQQQTAPVTVTDGKIAVAPEQNYSQAGTLKANVTMPTGSFVLPTGYTTPNQFGITLDAGDSYPAVSRQLCTAGQTPAANACLGADGTVGGLYPKDYTLYAGCSTSGAGSTVKPVISGTLPTGTVALTGVKAGLTASGTQGATVSATLLGRPGCTNQNITLSAVQSVGNLISANLNLALPAGDWKITVKRPAQTDWILPSITSTTPFWQLQL